MNEAIQEISPDRHYGFTAFATLRTSLPTNRFRELVTVKWKEVPPPLQMGRPISVGYIFTTNPDVSQWRQRMPRPVPSKPKK
jgi:hypothetical protein